MLVLWLLFWLTPVVFSRTAHESFRLPKLLLSDCVALASLVVLSLRLRRIERIDGRDFLRQPGKFSQPDD